MKRRIIRTITLVVAFVTMIFAASCATCERWATDCQSEMNNGIPREINIYTYDGELLAHYEGKIDIESHENYILFEHDGKRYIYYYGSGIVEIIEK